MIKNLFLHHSLKIINEYYPQYNNAEIKQISYGLEGIYLTFSKLIIIFALAFLLNIFNEVLLLVLLFNIIRLPAFGVHASKSLSCLTISSLFFLVFPLFLKVIHLSLYIKIFICSLLIIIFIIYAPADTKKRPIINKTRRLKLKIISVAISVIFTIGAVLINNIFISNSLIAALLIEAIMIIPLTYRLFNQEYNNYKKYAMDY